MRLELELTDAEEVALARIAKNCGHNPHETALACLREWLVAEGRGRLTRAMTYRGDLIFEPIIELPE